MQIELPEPQAKLLQQYCRQTHRSEAEVLSQALAQFLPPSAKTKRSLREHPAFGHWRHKKQDGLAYQNCLRDEWSA